jgi:UPF0148 protein
VSKDLTKKAVEMLLSGATLVSDPCPYCKGVRVMKNGNALCVSCGRQAKDEVESPVTTEKPGGSAIDNLDQKLKDLTVELQSEKDFEKQKQILHTMNEILAIKEKLGAH